MCSMSVHDVACVSVSRRGRRSMTETVFSGGTSRVVFFQDQMKVEEEYVEYDE